MGNGICFLSIHTSLLACAALRTTKLFHLQKKVKNHFPPETGKLSKTPNGMRITNNSAVGKTGWSMTDTDGRLSGQTLTSLCWVRMDWDFSEACNLATSRWIWTEMAKGKSLTPRLPYLPNSNLSFKPHKSWIFIQNKQEYFLLLLFLMSKTTYVFLICVLFSWNFHKYSALG